MAEARAVYPVGLHLEGRRVLVVGGGDVAYRKVTTLLQGGANVAVTAPEIGEPIRALVRGGEVSWRARRYATSDIADGVSLVFAATDDSAVNRDVASDARAKGIWVNVADEPSLCDFDVPAVFARAPLVVAVFTGGASPGFAAMLRTDLAGAVSDAHIELLRLLDALRRELPRGCRDALRPLASHEALAIVERGAAGAEELRGKVVAACGKHVSAERIDAILGGVRIAPDRRGGAPDE